MALGLHGCGEPVAKVHEAGTPEGMVAELVEAYTPLDRTVTSDVEDAKFVRQLKVLDQCSQGGEEVGRVALERLRQPHERIVGVERALLMVAARAATKDTQPLLEKLVLEYGSALELRTEAALLLAEVAPERALEILEPMITKTKQTMTMPPAEFLVRAWVIACERTGRSPVPALADVATNLYQEGAARVRAVKELGRHKDPRSEAALRTILVESTGDGYLRRMAAQSLHAILPAEMACALFNEVASKEADMNFLRFLANALDLWCK
ncbi:MAG: hypothetical protein JNL28_07040 [Planctomycetes bacterium]|nr:hypothetical protein [Planctomycetota bacterium]